MFISLLKVLHCFDPPILEKGRERGSGVFYVYLSSIYPLNLIEFDHMECKYLSSIAVRHILQSQSFHLNGVNDCLYSLPRFLFNRSYKKYLFSSSFFPIMLKGIGGFHLVVILRLL